MNNDGCPRTWYMSYLCGVLLPWLRVSWTKIAVQSNGLGCAYNVLAPPPPPPRAAQRLSRCVNKERCMQNAKISMRKRASKEAKEGESSDNDCRNIAAKCFSICWESDATPVKICKAAALIAPHDEASSVHERERERGWQTWDAVEGNEVGGNAKVKAKAKAMAKADAAQQDVNKNHRLALRGNEAGNELQQR